MKKILTTLASLLILGASAYGDIKVNKIDAATVEITFTYKNDDYTEMGVIGNFDNWTTPGEAMTKNAAGLWEKSIKASSVDMIQYKFFSGGDWFTDENAPDFKDDGFGGENGLIPVADVLSGAIAVPGAAAVAVVVDPNARKRLTFATDTYLETNTVFATSDEYKLSKSEINAKSIWKLEGDMAPFMPGYLEVTAFNGSPDLYADGGIVLDEGLNNLYTGFLINPFFYLGDNKRPTLDKLKFGFDTPWILYEGGYQNAYMPAHDSVLWSTVDDEVLANQGYSYFRLAKGLRTIGDVTVDAAVMPNRSQLNAFGLLTWANVSAFGVTGEFQYEMKASSTDSTLYFKDPAQTNMIGGLQYVYTDYVAKAQFLTSAYQKNTGSDKAPADAKIAYKFAAGYQAVDKSGEWILGYASRGGLLAGGVIQPTAKMLFAVNDDVLGASATSTISLVGFQTIGTADKVSLDASFMMPIGKNPSKNMVASVKPGYLANLSLGMDVVVDAYLLVKYNTEPATGTEAFDFSAMGAKVSIPSLDVYYNLNNGVKDDMFNTLLADYVVQEGFNAQLGVGVRTGDLAVTSIGLFAGTSYVLNIPEIRTPKVYGQIVYNMDPYKSEGAATFDLDNFGPNNGAAGFDGQSALRMGISWSY